MYSAIWPIWKATREATNLILVWSKYSFEWFKREGLRELFDEFSPFSDFTGKSMESHFLDYHFDKPRYTDAECRDHAATFSAPLRVNVRLVIKETGEVNESEIFMGDFPIMSENGKFVVNGAERVVVSQLVPSPGIYFIENVDPVSGRSYYGAKLIPNRGAWLEFETSNKAAKTVWFIWARSRTKPAEKAGYWQPCKAG